MEKKKSRDLNASDMEACRICLATDVKLHSLQYTPLKTCMESITGFTKTCEGLPNYVCYQCAPILLKCGKLIEKSKTAQSTLLDIFEKNGQLTKTLLKEQNRSQLNLESSLNNYLLLNYDFIHYDGDVNASESIQSESVPDMKIETAKFEIKDERTETDKARLDDSVQEIKVETPVIEVSDDEDFISLVPHRLNENLQKCTKGISSKYQGPERPNKIDLKRKLRENFNEIQRDFTIFKLPYIDQLIIWRRTQECIQTGSELLCNVCGMSFSNADLLQAHLILHNPSIHGKLKCAVCQLSFWTNAELDYHIETIHANRFYCKSCPMRFNNLEDAKCHKDLCTGSLAPGGSIRSDLRVRGPKTRLPLEPSNLNPQSRMIKKKNKKRRKRDMTTKQRPELLSKNVTA